MDFVFVAIDVVTKEFVSVHPTHEAAVKCN